MGDGPVPEGWQLTALASVAGVRTEKVEPKNALGVPYVALEHLDQGSPRLLGWSLSDSATSTKTVFKTGDVLFGKLRPNLRKAAPAPFDGVASTDIIPLYARGGTDPRFLLHLCQWRPLQDHAISTAEGTKMPRTSWTALRRFQIALPPLPEQRKIAEILSSVDDVIEKTEAVIEQVRRVKQGLAQQLLTRGLPGRHTRFKQTEVGDIPEEWEAVALKSIVRRCQYGLSAPLTSDPVGVPVLRMNNLADGGINTDDLKYAALSENDRKVYLLKPGDLLFNRTNSKDLVGKVSLFTVDSEMAFASYLLRLQVAKELALPMWLNHYLNLPGVQATFRRLATPGVSQTNVNAQALLKTLIPLPPIDEQRAIVKTVDESDRRIASERESLAALRAAKSALMHVLLTGQVRVRPGLHAPKEPRP